MANEKQNANVSPDVSGGLTITPEQLQALIESAVKAGRAPIVDEQKEAQTKRNQERMRFQIREANENKVARENNCTHLRDDNTSRIAWAVNRIAAKSTSNAPFYIKEGFCQACNKHFHPSDPQYAQYVRIPVGRAGIL